MAAFDDLISQLASRDPDQEAALDQYLAQLQSPAPQPPPAAPMPPVAAPQAVDTETAPVVSPPPAPAPGTPPGRPTLPPRQMADRTLGENVGLVGTSLADAFANAANRLGNRPQAPSNLGGAYRAQVSQNVANRQAAMDRGRQQDIQTMFQDAAEARALQKQQQEAAMRDPNSPQSEAAWRAVQFRRQESGLEPLPDELRKSFTAADAEGFVKNAPQAFTSLQQREQAREAAIRKQAEQATSAQEQLAVLKALNVPVGDINTDDPAAVKLAYDTAMKRLGWEQSEKRARITAAGMRGRNEGGTAAALPPGSAGTQTVAELMDRPDQIRGALTDIDRKMDELPTDEAGTALYKRLADKRKKIDEMGKYVLPGMRFTKTPTQKGFEQGGNLMAVRNDMHRILDAARELSISGIDEAVLAKIGEYSGAITPSWLQEQFPALRDAEVLAGKLARLKQVIANSIIVKKNEAELGAITGADMGLVHDMLGNPTGFLELASGRGIKSLESSVSDVDASYDEKMDQFGYGPMGAGESPQERQPGDPMARVRALWPSMTEQERSAVRTKLGKDSGWEP